MKGHAFFKSINWDKLSNKEIRPLFKPRVESKCDLSNIDRYFTREEANETPEEDSLLKTEKFPAFTYVEQNNDMLNLRSMNLPIPESSLEFPDDNNDSY